MITYADLIEFCIFEIDNEHTIVYNSIIKTAHHETGPEDEGTSRNNYCFDQKDTCEQENGLGRAAN